jgi:hypothetical protein
VPRFIGRLFAGEFGVVLMTGDPRRVERQGQARPGVAATASELAAGVRGGMTERERLDHEMRPVAFATAYRSSAACPRPRIAA